jgi:hypothetical protein
LRAGRQGRPLFVSILVVATVWAAILPPTHIHLAAADHDDHDGDHHDDHHHAAAIEHAHWAGHRSLGAAVDDGEDEGRALFVDHPAVVSPIVGHIEVPRSALLVLLAVPRPPIFTSDTRRISGNAPRDGPSRDIYFLRGPPFVL